MPRIRECATGSASVSDRSRECATGSASVPAFPHLRECATGSASVSDRSRRVDAAAKLHPRERSRGAFTPIPHPRIPASPNPRPRAFTLIELLVVISIIVIMMGIMAASFGSNTDERRVREAARAINLYLGSARNRAIESGRPSGVILRNFGAPGFAMTADQCEVPPNYCGTMEESVAVVTAVTNTELTVNLFTSVGGSLDPLPSNMVQRGDLIQLNFQGPLYTINNTTSDPDPSTGSVSSLTLRPQESVLVSTSLASQALPYRIFRSPMKSYAQPLQLPAATVVDLAGSGIGDDGAWNTGITSDVIILFSPNGSIQSVNGSPVVAPIYLLIGKRERVNNTYTQDNPNESTLTNSQDMNNLWVTINPSTGAVQTEPVASCAGVSSWSDAIIAARSEARKGQGMGGR